MMRSIKIITKFSKKNRINFQHPVDLVMINGQILRMQYDFACQFLDNSINKTKENIV